MVRPTLAVLIASLLLAPVQCASKPDPELRNADTAGDGLWALAEDFKAKGNDEAYKATLRFLIARYPGHRRAVKARDELHETDAPAAVPATNTATATATASAPAVTK